MIKMTKELTAKLIKLYQQYNELSNPPDLIHTLKWYLTEVEGINPDKITPGDSGGD